MAMCAETFEQFASIHFAGLQRTLAGEHERLSAERERAFGSRLEALQQENEYLRRQLETESLQRQLVEESKPLSKGTRLQCPQFDSSEVRGLERPLSKDTRRGLGQADVSEGLGHAARGNMVATERSLASDYTNNATMLAPSVDFALTSSVFFCSLQCPKAATRGDGACAEPACSTNACSALCAHSAEGCVLPGQCPANLQGAVDASVPSHEDRGELVQNASAPIPVKSPCDDALAEHRAAELPSDPGGNLLAPGSISAAPCAVSNVGLAVSFPLSSGLNEDSARAVSQDVVQETSAAPSAAFEDGPVEPLQPAAGLDRGDATPAPQELAIQQCARSLECGHPWSTPSLRPHGDAEVVRRSPTPHVELAPCADGRGNPQDAATKTRAPSRENGGDPAWSDLERHNFPGAASLADRGNANRASQDLPIPLCATSMQGTLPPDSIEDVDPRTNGDSGQQALRDIAVEVVTSCTEVVLHADGASSQHVSQDNAVPSLGKPTGDALVLQLEPEPDRVVAEDSHADTDSCLQASCTKKSDAVKQRVSIAVLRASRDGALGDMIEDFAKRDNAFSQSAGPVDGDVSPNRSAAEPPTAPCDAHSDGALRERSATSANALNDNSRAGSATPQEVDDLISRQWAAELEILKTARVDAMLPDASLAPLPIHNNGEASPNEPSTKLFEVADNTRGDANVQGVDPTQRAGREDNEAAPTEAAAELLEVAAASARIANDGRSHLLQAGAAAPAPSDATIVPASALRSLTPRRTLGGAAKPAAAAIRSFWGAGGGSDVAPPAANAASTGTPPPRAPPKAPPSVQDVAFRSGGAGSSVVQELRRARLAATRSTSRSGGIGRLACS
mmetsp:Transcript_25445/g.70933  ORF Transcript_25445/g.70933 Transcript_25445/m.70933 type:complete len:850 (+) Transcript_25445:115-2664(+)